MQIKSYQSADDLKRVQQALMHWTQQAGDCNYWHKGDIRHRLFNGGYQHNPQDILHYWLNDREDILAFVQLYPYRPMHWFELHVAPDLRYSAFHIEAFQWAEEAMRNFARRINIDLDQIRIESFACDAAYDEFIRARGYSYDQTGIVYTEHNFQHIPDASLPAGFYFHDASADDAKNLADVHNHSFGNKWTADSYGKVFSAPLMEYEIVTVAPDGRFAAFTNVWFDEINKTIVFEPVGTHEDFRRMGIARAMMATVMKRMQVEQGARRALVCHDLPEKNPASGALYASLGFRAKYQIQIYSKRLKSV